MDYNHQFIEEYVAQKWAKQDVYKVENDYSKPKFYVLDMFPYPSGAGLHVGHPLGYIASDIYARYKRLKGFNVLHPMGYDAFGLPAEQYAIQTGQHPAITTEKNIKTFKRQLDKIGFSFDWSRVVSTCEPEYYKWTQWIFLKLFDSWFNQKTQKAEHIDKLIAHFEQKGNTDIQAACSDKTPVFSAQDWAGFSTIEKQETLMNYRLAYRSFAYVNWCPALGTVLANDEVKDGFSERGEHPVEKKKMAQWFLRITAYAERLLQGLDNLDWSDSMKEMQRNWIGKSKGASVRFQVKDSDQFIEVFTTRVDTIFGVTFLVLAPEHELVQSLTTDEYKQEIEQYIKDAGSRSEIERQADVRESSGQFTGGYVLHPFTGKQIPVYIADYVLAGYGTGAVMAVPSGDQRDYLFANKYELPIIPILSGQKNIKTEADPTKEGEYINSDFINGLTYEAATDALIKRLEEMQMGKGKIQFKMRDAGYSRQRYWGEPFPIYYKGEEMHAVRDLPVTLPEVTSYKPSGTGESPLANAPEWVKQFGEDTRMETDTMPGYAGSSWYFLRYMDAQNNEAFCGKEASSYWKNVDLYVGGSEHAVGHLLYSRFWHKFLKDNDLVATEEPFQKLVNQGMILGVSAYIIVGVVNRYKNEKSSDNKYLIDSKKTPLLLIDFNSYKIMNQEVSSLDYETIEKIQSINFKISKELEKYTNRVKEPFETGEFVFNNIFSIKPIPIGCLNSDGSLNIEKLKNDELWKNEIKDAEFLYIGEKYFPHREVEKMSKSKYNVVNPDDVIAQFGADCFRMFEMFLGPIDQAKPWDMQSIGGIARFLGKFWRLFNMDVNGNPQLIKEGDISKDDLKILHKTIKKVTEDIEKLSYNTAVSTFMICVNELGKSKVQHYKVLKDLVILMAPFAPFTSEFLWEKIGESGSVVKDASFPIWDDKYLIEDVKTYPISINGKVRVTMDFPADATPAHVEETALNDERVQKYLEGKTPKKVIVVPGRIVNIVM
jgi:leucyl-tRNA synthetase